MGLFALGSGTSSTRGDVTRRRFCQTVGAGLALFGAANAAAGAAKTAAFRAVSINHISYSCPDYRRARDFYTAILGMKPAPRSDNGKEVRLVFDPNTGGERTFLIPRNGRTTVRARAFIGRIGYGIAEWDDGALRSALSSRGLIAAESAGTLLLSDPFGFDVQLLDAPDLHAGTRANGPDAAAAPAATAAYVDHVSYICPNFRQAASWYAALLGAEEMESASSSVTLALDADEGLPNRRRTRLIFSSDGKDAGANARLHMQARIDHIAYTISGFDKERVRQKLHAMGFRNPLQDGEHSFHIVDLNGFDVQISGAEMTALRN